MFRLHNKGIEHSPVQIGLLVLHRKRELAPGRIYCQHSINAGVILKRRGGKVQSFDKVNLSQFFQIGAKAGLRNSIHVPYYRLSLIVMDNSIFGTTPRTVSILPAATLM